VNTADEKLSSMRAELNMWRQLSLSTDGNYADANADAILAQIK
jgi:hypothetical protein